MSVRRGILLIAALLALGACAPADEVAEEPAGPDDVVSTTVPSPDEPVPEPEPEVVEPRTGLVDVRARPWDEAVAVGPRELEIRFWGGVEDCWGVDRVEVDEGPDEVTVTLFEGAVPTAEACIEIALFQAVRVTLDAPLAGREVVDGAQGS